jgi:hypothetical protein
LAAEAFIQATKTSANDTVDVEAVATVMAGQFEQPFATGDEDLCKCNVTPPRIVDAQRQQH